METVSVEQLLEEGKIVKIGKNQVFKDGELYVVEKYEFTESNGTDMFSVYDGYSTVFKAISVALRI